MTMNDHELDLALSAMGQQRTTVADLPELHELVRSTAANAPQPPGFSPTITTWRTQSMFSATKFVVAAVIVALFGGFLLTSVLTQQTEEAVPAVGASASPSPEATYVVTRISSNSLRGGYVATDEALWALNNGGVSRLDPETGEVTGIATTDGIRWLVPTDDAIWAVGRDGVQRIARIDLTVSDEIRRARNEPFWGEGDGQCYAPVIADGSLWIASPGSESHTLIEIDLASQTIRDEYLAEGDWSSIVCGSLMAVIGDAIWVQHSTDFNGGQRLTRFDLGTRQFTDRIDDLPDSLWPSCCIVDDDAIWLMHERSLSRFDVATHEITDTLDVGGNLSGGIATPGAIWVADGQSPTSGGRFGVVYRIDTSTREVTDVIGVGEGPEQPAFLHGAIWVANHGDPSVSRIDLESRQVTDTMWLPIGVEHPHTSLASDGVIWVYTEEVKLLRIDHEMANK
jgi:hypothetical protein